MILNRETRWGRAVLYLLVRLVPNFIPFAVEAVRVGHDTTTYVRCFWVRPSAFHFHSFLFALRRLALLMWLVSLLLLSSLAFTTGTTILVTLGINWFFPWTQVQPYFLVIVASSAGVSLAVFMPAMLKILWKR